MINIPGVLTIRIVAGRYGDFRVGRLITGIGEFAVKDQQLDQYLEGSYEGVFGVSRIYPTNYTAGGRMVIEVRADIQTIALININPLEQFDALLEQDPIEQDKAAKPVSRSDPVSVAPTPAVIDVKPEPEATIPAQATLDDFKAVESDLQVTSDGILDTATFEDGDDNNVDAKDEKLFGLLWPLGDHIKLDASIDRNLFRAQRDRLKELGYCFKPIGQLWTKP